MKAGGETYLLDTDTVSYALCGVAGVSARLLEHAPERIAISSLTLAELRFGAERRGSKKLHKLLDAFCNGVGVLPFDEEGARRYGEIGAALAERGSPIGQVDTLIAAHALALDRVLVTNNAQHFSRVRGLRTEKWSRTSG
jgi:tRNA(fMet)-specific endonuclease VapC